MSSLWLGEDHFVYAKGRGFLVPFSEEYRRYRYGDIQAFSLVKTSRAALGLLYTFGLLLVVGVLTLLAVFGSGDSFGTGVAVTAAIFSLAGLCLLALLLRHLILGPTCLCDIQTSLSHKRILSLGRYHQAQQVIHEIGIKIEESQSGLEAGEGVVETALASTAVSDFYSIPSMSIPAAGVAILTALSCLAAIHLQNVVVVGVGMLLLFAVSILLLVALVQSVKRATPRSIKTVLWTILGLLFVLVGVGVVFFLIEATANPEYTLGIEGPLRAFTQIDPSEGIVFYLIFLILNIGILAAGIAGVVSAFRWKSKLGKGSPESRQATNTLGADE